MGMKDGTIPDAAIEGSSQYNFNYIANKARLDGHRYWNPKDSSTYYLNLL